MQTSKNNWITTTFGEVAIQQKADIDRESSAVDRYVAGGHMNSEDLHIRQWGVFNGQYLGPAFRRKFENGDILYGSRRTYLKKVAVANFDGITANTTFVIKSNKEKIYPALLPFLMLSDSFTEHSIKHSKGSVNPYINWKDIANYEFKLPSCIDDQKRIADLLWSIDEAEQKQNVLIDRMHGAKQVFIDNRLFDSKDKYLKLSEIGDDIRGVNFKPSDIMQAKGHNVVILRANNISNDAINYDDVIFVKKERVNEAQILKAGDFAICMSSGSKILLGKAAEYHQSRDKEIAVGAFCSIYRLKNLSAHFDLVKYYFQSGIYKKQVSLLLSGTNINNLKKSDILGLRVPIATNAKECVAKLHKIDNMANLIAEQNKKLKKIKKQLINQIFG